MCDSGGYAVNGAQDADPVVALSSVRSLTAAERATAAAYVTRDAGLASSNAARASPAAAQAASTSSGAVIAAPDLFARAAQFDLRLPDLPAVPRERLGETLMRIFLDRWGQSDALPIMLRAAMTNAAAASQLQAIYRDQLAAAVITIAPAAEAQERAGMVASQVLGLAICRYVLKFPPLAAMPGDQVVARFGPTLQRYLTGPLA